jgi:hypothetical protein
LRSAFSYTERHSARSNDAMSLSPEPGITEPEEPVFCKA